ncbi:hypothetical protein IAU60_006545 [Kwoniella sp. DSM 27419]
MTTNPIRHIRPCPQPFSDHIAGTVDGVDLPLRVFPAASGEGRRPWMLWIHGGGFVGGKHHLPNCWVWPAFHPLGVHIVSISYRYVPQVDMPALWTDIEKGYRWCRENLTKVLAESDGCAEVDMDRWVVAGDSAGGHLASLAAIKFEPKPKVVIDIFGVVDLADPYMNEPATFHIPLPFNTPEEVLQKELKDHDPANATTISAWTWEIEPEMSKEMRTTYWGAEYDAGEKDKIRQDVNTYLSITGDRIRAMLPDAKGEEALQKAAKAWSPTHLIDTEDSYPTTVVMHGDADDIVPIEQSYQFADKIEKKGAQVKRIWCPGGKHSFDNTMGDPAQEGWKEYIQPCVDFVSQQLRT